MGFVLFCFVWRLQDPGVDRGTEATSTATSEKATTASTWKKRKRQGVSVNSLFVPSVVWSLYCSWLNQCMHTHTHTCACTHTHACTYAYLHAYTHTNTHMHSYQLKDWFSLFSFRWQKQTMERLLKKQDSKNKGRKVKDFTTALVFASKHFQYFPSGCLHHVPAF